jgi:hypothetical protein
MMFRVVLWDILPSSLMMEAVRTSETSVDNQFTRQYIPEDNSEHHMYYLLDWKVMTKISGTFKDEPHVQGEFQVHSEFLQNMVWQSWT